MPRKPNKMNQLVLDTVRGEPGMTQRELYRAVRIAIDVRDAHMPWREREYPITGGHFYNRLGRLVKAGLLHKALIRGANRYYISAECLKDFNLKDQEDLTARLVAADCVQEHGDDELAKAMRTAKRFT